MPSYGESPERVMAEARASLQRQRDGGRRVLPPRAALIRRQRRQDKLVRVGVAIGAVLLAAVIAGLVVDGIGLTGLFVTVLALAAVTFLFGRYPRERAPDLSTLNTGDTRTMIGRTELWLDSQRRALPAPSRQIVDQIGFQLDALGNQLEGLDPAEPALGEVRRLVGEHLPGMVASYRRIPEHLRTEERGGRSADAQLTDGLTKISREIDDLTRQLAAGDLDSLAVQARYLDYRYGEALEQGDIAPALDKPALKQNGDPA